MAASGTEPFVFPSKCPVCNSEAIREVDEKTGEADVVKRCTFAEVKKDPSKVVGENIAFAFKGGADSFIHKGTNGRWVGVLDDEDLALYDEAMAKLPPDYADWLQNGGQA